MKRYTEAEKERVKEKHPISTIIGRHVTWHKGKTNAGKGDFWACCPFHQERTPSFHCLDREHTYKCFGCGATGDQFTFLQEHEGLSFVEAMEGLGGEADTEPLTPEQVAEEEKRKAEKRRQQEAFAEQKRQEEIRKASRYWNWGGRVAGTEGVGYLRGRGLMPMPVPLPLRFHPHFKYWHQRPVAGDERKKEFYVLFSGPVMMAAITGPDGAFLGLHVTYFDPARPGKKIAIEDPYAEPDEDGNLPLVVPKKIRGSKRNASIKLWQPPEFNRLVVGEGWETTASVLLAEHGTERFERTAYWTSIDLQSMGGKAVETVAHPTLKNKAGRPLKVPGPDPDMSDEKALTIPDHVEEVLRLGDGDSDRFTAEQVMARADARWARPGRRQHTAWAPEGEDFNDILMGAALG
ncbi:CHC2 zinc finger domain-containing protein [Roseibium sp. CAU 1639]|uniref:CHC2 zinc finger domain-containing protein n=2 Tax=Roseibium sediminicola TaxID=2933272 RepID=A0ABT0GT13_9HYPH|nr:CHC2 zinc finger domain-containing protein [Roseibium sp. CAU 1639]MCK7611980.1 CHC2 zinc finger domain-containing protein [Roseibium sp. CAU 1639]